jgi:hypothetical protein
MRELSSLIKVSDSNELRRSRGNGPPETSLSELAGGRKGKSSHELL